MARAVALLATLLLHALLAMFLFGGWQLPSWRGLSRTETPRVNPTAAVGGEASPLAGTTAQAWPPIEAAAVRSTQHTSVDAREQAVLRATAAGQAYERRHQEAMHRWRRQFYGENIAALMRLPVAQAWPALEELLADGDPLAADALLDLSGQCAEGSSQSRMDALATSMVQDLDPVATAFVLGAMGEETRWLLAQQQACRAAGLGSRRLAQLAGREIDPDSERSPAGQATDAFNEVFRSEGRPGLDFPSPHAELLETLGADPSSLSEDDWLTLLAAIDSDALVAASMSHCLDQGCPGMPALPLPERRQLLEEAAGAGSVWAAATLAASLESDGDLVSTYAWWLYTRWASATGCIPVSTTYELANAARQVQRLEPLLTPEQRRLAAFQAQQLMLRHASRMRTLWNCSG